MSQTPRPFAPMTATVTLNSAGYGFCFVACPNGVMRRVTLTSVSTNIPPFPPTVQPVCNIYRSSSPSQSSFIESTYNGNGRSSDTEHLLVGGDYLCAEWIGGQAGALATLRVAGVQVS